MSKRFRYAVYEVVSALVVAALALAHGYSRGAGPGAWLEALAFGLGLLTLAPLVRR